jgi:hypothetical protein
MMSNAQLLYLEMHINKKLYRDVDCLPRFIAHKNLWLRLRPLAADAHDEISTSGEALRLANEEARSWLGRGKAGRMSNFEDQVAALALGNGSANSDPTHQLLEPDQGKREQGGQGSRVCLPVRGN